MAEPASVAPVIWSPLLAVVTQKDAVAVRTAALVSNAPTFVGVVPDAERVAPPVVRAAEPWNECSAEPDKVAAPTLRAPVPIGVTKVPEAASVA